METEIKKDQRATYNGWRNYETSCVALWLDNEAGTHRFWREQAKKHQGNSEEREQVKNEIWTQEEAAVFYFSNQIKVAIQTSNPLADLPSLYNDLLTSAIGEVCFEEIAENWLSDLEREPLDLHAYTRENTIEEGVLIDVSETAMEAGIVYPTALTHAVWANYVEVPEGVEHQDEDGRLWDVLWMFQHAAKQTCGGLLEYQLLVANDNSSPKLVTLKAVADQAMIWSPSSRLCSRTKASSPTARLGLRAICFSRSMGEIASIRRQANCSRGQCERSNLQRL